MSENSELNKALSYMAYRVLKPLVIFFLRYSIPYQTASDWMKRIYIDTVLENKEFRINPQKKQTKTRVAVLTGLSRVEIDRVLKIEKPLEATEQKWNRATKVLSGWSNDKNYIDHEGKPKILNVSKGDISFQSLVDQYSGGATMRSILDELRKVKSIELIEDKVKMIRKDYSQLPEGKKVMDIELFGMYSGDLLNTLVFNDSENDPVERKFQKVVLNRYIPEDSINEAKSFIYKETDKLLITIDNKLSKIQNQNNKESLKTIGLGTYYFEGEHHE